MKRTFFLIILFSFLVVLTNSTRTFGEKDIPNFQEKLTPKPFPVPTIPAPKIPAPTHKKIKNPLKSLDKTMDRGIKNVVNWHWTLSGGGAKGSFQVGALKYLFERLKRFRPVSITSTSVGSIIALPIAEGTQAGYEKLERSWLRLRHNYHMFVPADWHSKIPRMFRQIYGGIVCPAYPYSSCLPETNLFTEERDDDSPSVLGRRGIHIIGVSEGIILNIPVLGGIVATLAAEDAEDDLNTLNRLYEDAQFIYNLFPVYQSLQRNIDVGAIRRSGIKLRLVSVGLENQRIQYVTEDGKLMIGHASRGFPRDIRSITAPWFPPNSNPELDHTLTGVSVKEALINGAMASAAIPGLFPPIVLNTNGGFTTSVDGGVREVLPVRGTLELIEGSPGIGKEGIIAISAGAANEVNPRSLIDPEENSDFRKKNFLSLTLKAVDIQIEETHLNEINPVGGWHLPIKKIHIKPAFNVHETQQIDPGLLLISMAYGYMAAFDAFHQSDQEVYNQLYSNTLIIIQARKHAWEKEEKLIRKIIKTPPTSSSNLERRLNEVRTLILEIRRLKRLIFNAVKHRIENWGIMSLPYEFSDRERNYINTLSDWWMKWERHESIDGASLSDAPGFLRFREGDLCTTEGGVSSGGVSSHPGYRPSYGYILPSSFSCQWKSLTKKGKVLQQTSPWDRHYRFGGKPSSGVLVEAERDRPSTIVK